MNETIEDQLRRVLTQSALTEVPDSTPIPPRQPVDELAAKRGQRRWLAPVISGVAAAAIALLATLLVVGHSNSTDGVDALPAQVTVPSVVGLSLADAERSITSAGLTVGAVVSVESSTTSKGHVAAQQPGRGFPVDKATPVDLEVSNGVTAMAAPDLVTVPDLKTLTAAQANTRLMELHLNMKSVSVVSTDSQEGAVVGQSPAADAQVQVGATVTVQVAGDPNLTRVPAGLVGLSYNQAVAALKASNLTATQQVVDGIQPLGTVVKVTRPAGGASVLKGTTILLQTSNSELFTVPNLANLSPAAAATKLKTLGWTGSVERFRTYFAPITDRTRSGKIANGLKVVTNAGDGKTVERPGQDPAVGTTARKTAQITIVVYNSKQIALPKFIPGVTTRDEIVNALTNLGATKIILRVQSYAVPPSVPHTVISMTPSSGSYPYDTQITITVWGEAPPSAATRSTPTTPTK